MHVFERETALSRERSGYSSIIYLFCKPITLTWLGKMPDENQVTLDFNGLLHTLDHAASQPQFSESLRGTLHLPYKNEIAVLLDMLFAFGILSPAIVLHPNPPEGCDSCQEILLEHSWFVDGEIKGYGAWANLCPACYLGNGAAIT